MYENGINWSNLIDGLEGFAQTVATAVALLLGVGWFKSAKGWVVISVILIAESMCMLYTSYKDAFENGITWENLCLTLEGFATAVAAAITTITIGKFIQKGSGMWGICIGFANTVSFLLIAAGMCGLYIAFKDAFENGINWENLTWGLAAFGLVVAGVLSKLKISKMQKGTAEKIGEAGQSSGSGKSPTSAWKILGAGLAIVASFLLLAAGMCAIYYAFPKAFENGMDWGKISKGLAKFAGAVGIAIAVGAVTEFTLGGQGLFAILAGGLAAAAPFLLIAAGMCLLWEKFEDPFTQGIEWSNLTIGLKDFATDLKDALKVAAGKTLGSIPLIGGILAALTSMTDVAPFLIIACYM